MVSFGEALIDFKEQAQLNYQGYEGGSPMNVTVAAARLGASVGFVTQLSTDVFGDALMRHLEKNKVSTDLVLRSDAPTTLAFVTEQDGDAHFTFLNNGAADTLYDPQPRPVLPDSVKFVQFGSISLLTEPTASTILEMVSAHRARSTVVLDPNVRPALIDDKNVFFDKLHAWLKLAHVVKVSTQDLRWLYGDTDLTQVARGWLAKGPDAIIITDGGNGVSLHRKAHEVLTVRAPSVEVEDTVGAGDTFTGSLMVALEEANHHPAELSTDVWRDALYFAASAAAFNCTRAGANPPTREELTAFMAQQ